MQSYFFIFNKKHMSLEKTEIINEILKRKLYNVLCWKMILFIPRKFEFITPPLNIIYFPTHVNLSS